MSKTYTLGIDLHKRVSTWVLLDDKGEEICTYKRILVRPTDITTAIKKLPVASNNIKVGLEPVCGWRWVVDILESCGMEVHVANPLKHKSISDSDFKNDMNDATELAHLLRVNRFYESYRAPDAIYNLRNILRQRSFLVDQRTAAKLRLHGCCTATGIHNIPGENPLTKEGKEYILQSDDLLMKDLLGYITHMDERVTRYDLALEKQLKEYPDAQYLLSIPGCGTITALSVIAEVGDFSRFTSPESLARFAGLLPREHSSGGKTKNGKLMRGGDRILRSALVELAMRIRETNAPELYSFYIILSEKKPKKLARTALAHKLLGIMWRLMKDKTNYSPETILTAARNAKYEQTREGSLMH